MSTEQDYTIEHSSHSGEADDTIAAIATPPGVGGVGIIRISGARAFAIGRALFRPAQRLPEM